MHIPPSPPCGDTSSVVSWLCFIPHTPALPHPQLPLAPYLQKQVPNMEPALAGVILKGANRCFTILLACCSLQVFRAVTLFAVSPLPSGAAFRSFVPLSLHAAPSGQARARVAHSFHYATRFTSISPVLFDNIKRGFNF